MMGCLANSQRWQNHHVKDILCHVKWPWSIVNAIQAWPTTEIYDMVGKHWLNTISLLSGGAVRRTWPPHGLGKWEVPAGDKFSRERGRRKR